MDASLPRSADVLLRRLGHDAVDVRRTSPASVKGELRCENAVCVVVLDISHVRRYLTRVKTTVSSKGQIVLPAELRQQDRIKPGQEFEVERVDRGEYRLVRRSAQPNQGLVDWLLSCPEKDFFVPIESESTEAL